MKNMPEKFRKALREKEYLVTPGLANPMHAMVLEQLGFDYIYMSGFVTSVTMMGWPDVGLLTQTEMVTNARNIANAVNIPVIADADTGYGNAINLIRAMEDYEAAGVAGVHIEDQVLPNRCGHLAGTRILPFEEAVGKIRAAVATKRNRDFVVIARTDAVAAVGGGIEEAIKRGKAFAEAGADMVFSQFPSSEVEMPKRFAEEVRKAYPNIPLFFNYSQSFDWTNSKLTFRDLASMGYKVIILALACMRVSLQAVWDFAEDLKKREDEAEKDFQRKMKGHPTSDFNKFVGISRFRAKEDAFCPQEEVRKKYEESIGLCR